VSSGTAPNLRVVVGYGLIVVAVAFVAAGARRIGRASAAPRTVEG
jgi:hypothetical protein